MSLATRYLGLELKNPLVASAAPPNAHLDYLRRVEDAGAAAVVLPSLFQEQIEAEAAAEALIYSGTENNSPEASSYLPEPVTGPYGVGPDAYLDLIRHARAALAIPVIASLNGSTDAGWTDYAQLMQQAGAHAIELNLAAAVATDLSLDAQAVEDGAVSILTTVRQVVSLPVAVKMSPYASAPGNLAKRFADSGANGLVLFNRLVQPDIDLASLGLDTKIYLSTRDEMRFPLLWISLLAGRVDTSLAASTGVEDADDVVKYLLAGADIVMTTSALLRHGPGHLMNLLDGLRIWMDAREFGSVSDMRGLMCWQRSRRKALYGRPSYIKMLEMDGYRA